MPGFPIAARGYHRHQVDAFIARIEGTLGRAQLFAPPVTAAEVGRVRFPITLRGYRGRAVDERLEEYLRELEAKENGGRRRLSAAETDRLIGLVRNVRFVTTRLSEGYAEREVDAFLDRMIVELRGRRARSADVRAARFATTRIRPGYAQPDVDGFLDHLAAEIDRLAQA
ncbi:DivIVA domain-containing protein [Actinoallomurus purpureus]|uniref:DivIVA domain-containing protein n=1 Tax=Actinoallomurus purpureus TaxID=478114 RepID=UPI0025AF0E0C|nr:DivIVA domain-containing protein [Actinoallomurus purpureus]